MQTNLFAYTEPTNSLPGYISVNKKSTGNIEVTVRSTGQNNASAIELTEEQFCEFIEEMRQKGYGDTFKG